MLATIAAIAMPIVPRAALAQSDTARARSTPALTADLRTFVRSHGVPLHVSGDDSTSAPYADLAPLRTLLGDARVLAITEPYHGGHEPLALRNRIIRHCIVALRCTAVALETALTPSRLLDDYVRGLVPAGSVSDSALSAAFTYGFGRYRENIELLHWLRAHNATRPPAQRVGVYGVDLDGQFFPTAARSLEAVLAYLDRADPVLGRELRERGGKLLPVFRADTFPELPSAERERIAAWVTSVARELRAREAALARGDGRRDYDWALRQAVNAEQDLEFLRRIPAGLVRRMNQGLDSLVATDPVRAINQARDSAIAENVAWVLARQPADGRVLVFAHFAHLQTHPIALPGGGPLAAAANGSEVAGTYLRRRLGASLIVAGSYFGQGATGPRRPQPLPPDREGLDGMLAAPALDAYLVDLRALPSDSGLRAWLSREHEVRGSSFGQMRFLVRPALASDLLIYIDRITPARDATR